MAKINLWSNLSTVWWSCQSLKVQLLIKTNAPDFVFSETSDATIPHDLCYHMQHHNIPAGGAASLQKFFLMGSSAFLSHNIATAEARP